MKSSMFYSLLSLGISLFALALSIYSLALSKHRFDDEIKKQDRYK